MALLDRPTSGASSVRRLEGDEPMVLGAATALARRLDVDTFAVRVAFAVLTVAGGWGVLLYGATWLGLVWRHPTPQRPARSSATTITRTVGVVAMMVGCLLILRARVPGFADTLVWPVAIVAAGVMLGARQLGASAAPVPGQAGVSPTVHGGASSNLARLAGGFLLVVGGLGYLAGSNLPVTTLRDTLVAVAVVAAGVLLILGPWVLRQSRSLAHERRERIRADERAELATHLHDSVLQTLTLLQKRSDDPQMMAALARHQERELRRWLYGAPDPHDGRGFREAIEAMVAEVEDQHLVHVENVTVGDGPVDATLYAVMSAAREALVNAAKFSGERAVSLYAELRPQHVELYVRDRGRGFRLEEVGTDRKGISDSIVGRMDRLGGTAQVRTAPGAGTEVRVRLETAR